MNTTEETVFRFSQTGLPAQIISILDRAGLVIPTPIQHKAIPIALSGKDVIGIAQTGTGKTFAFALPIIERLLREPQKKALILVPTRELALQVEEGIRRVSRFTQPNVRTLSLIGGMPIYRQISELRHNPRILIATPGRLQDHLNQKTVSLAEVQMLVLDEADRMFDMGFAPQIKKIMESLPTDRQTMLFSATMAPEIVQLSSAYMTSPVRVEVSIAGSNNTQIEQELCYVRNEEKIPLLAKLLTENTGSVLVFVRTKHGAAKLTQRVEGMGFTAAEIHSNRSLGQRRHALEGFKSGRFRVLIATDVAARGIDVQDISLVINFDLPDAAEDYVHRIGRTGRAGKTGRAIALATHDQVRMVRTIESLMKTSLTLSSLSEKPVFTPPTNRRFDSSQKSRAFRPQQRRTSGSWR